MPLNNVNFTVQCVNKILIFSVAFRMYDLDGDNKITKDELLTVLTLMVGKTISKDQLLQIAERTFLEADVDKSNFITFDEYYKILETSDAEIKMSIKI